MTRMWKILVGTGAVALAATAASAAYAQATTGKDQATPSSFNWEIKDGKRVPKGQRQTAADGSWREEIRQGKCVTIKEKSAAGEYKETRKCD
jgi:anti-sigma28 factor (negative regulator of flagellin synthesis)